MVGSPKIRQQDVHADQEHPQREDKLGPEKETDAHEQNSASTRPRKAIQRGKIPVRNDSVQVEIMNTAAIFMA